LVREVPRRGGFGAPPVTEVALSIQFSSLPGLRLPETLLFWSEVLRDRFPRVEEHPTLPPTFETFDATPVQPEIRVEMLHGVPPRRMWFINDAGTELLQIQHDRFIFNWRQIEDEEYPRYERVRDGLLEHYETFAEFVQGHNIGELTPNQCEVTYVNQIAPGSKWKTHGDAAKVFSFWKTKLSDRFLPKPESTRASLEFVINRSETGPLGRLHVAAEPAYRVDNHAPIFIFTLTARGAPISDGTEGAVEFLDLGREWVVRGFTSLTTEAMHQQWRRNDGR